MKRIFLIRFLGIALPNIAFFFGYVLPSLLQQGSWIYRLPSYLLSAVVISIVCFWFLLFVSYENLNVGVLAALRLIYALGLAVTLMAIPLFLWFFLYRSSLNTNITHWLQFGWLFMEGCEYFIYRFVNGRGRPFAWHQGDFRKPLGGAAGITLRKLLTRYAIQTPTT